MSDTQDASQSVERRVEERLRARLVDELRSMGVHLSSDGALILTDEGAWAASSRPVLADILATA